MTAASARPSHPASDGAPRFLLCESVPDKNVSGSAMIPPDKQPSGRRPDYLGAGADSNAVSITSKLTQSPGHWERSARSRSPCLSRWHGRGHGPCTVATSSVQAAKRSVQRGHAQHDASIVVKDSIPQSGGSGRRPLKVERQEVLKDLVVVKVLPPAVGVQNRLIEIRMSIASQVGRSL